MDLNQTSADRKSSVGNISPATLANGNKQSNGYESPRVGRRFEALQNHDLCTRQFKKPQLRYVLK